MPSRTNINKYNSAPPDIQRKCLSIAGRPAPNRLRQTSNRVTYARGSGSTKPRVGFWRTMVRDGPFNLWR